MSGVRAVNPLAVTAFDHHSFTVADSARTVAFYTRWFGLAVAAEFVPSVADTEAITGIPGARLRVVHLTGYGQDIEFIQYLASAVDAPAARANEAGSSHLAFIVADVRAAVGALHAAGVPVVGDPVFFPDGDPDGRGAVYMNDPDGITIELIQLPRAAP